MPVSNMSKIGWVAVLTSCTALYAMLHLTVNSVKSEVRLAEREVVALEREAFRLETEFLTRANQRQLAEWNEVEFGYQAPEAGQFLENERALAALGTPRTADAPEPIRVAVAPVEEEGETTLLAMVSPLTGRAMAAELSGDSPIRHEQASTMAGEFRAAAVNQLSAKLVPDKVRVTLAGSRE